MMSSFSSKKLRSIVKFVRPVAKTVEFRVFTLELALIIPVVAFFVKFF